MNYIYINLFRHQAAEKVLYLKELTAACCHLFLKKGKGIWARSQRATLERKKGIVRFLNDLNYRQFSYLNSHISYLTSHISIMLHRTLKPFARFVVVVSVHIATVEVQVVRVVTVDHTSPYLFILILFFFSFWFSFYYPRD